MTNKYKMVLSGSEDLKKEPSKSVIQNILNFSKSTKVEKVMHRKLLIYLN